MHRISPWPLLLSREQSAAPLRLTRSRWPLAAGADLESPRELLLLRLCVQCKVDGNAHPLQ